jgi:flagellar capping protein FliD
LVFALTMAGTHDTVDAQLLDVRGQVDGLAADIRTMHERLDSTVTSTTERFNQLDLAQTATRTTLDTILARLDAYDHKDGAGLRR